MESKKERTKRKQTQRKRSRGDGIGRWVKKEKGNIVNNIAISVHGDRQLIELTD